MKRTVLVILSNRLNRLQKPKYMEVECDAKGNIASEKRLRSAPRQAKYDEVWESDEGKTELSSAYRMKRKYGHPLQKK
jgi:hypothetical protein